MLSRGNNADVLCISFVFFVFGLACGLPFW
jgi:hypothetical protein